MAASRTKAATVPEELIRQADRITEQLTSLHSIIDNSTSHLDDMARMMANYSPDLVQEIQKLNVALSSYRSKSASIYNEVSEGLKIYANDLMNNLSALQDSVKTISQAVEQL